MALGLIHALTEAHLSVPDEVSVVGFDDIPEAAHFSPPLTTMHQDFAQLGRDAMEVMLAVLSDEQAPNPLLRVPQLVVRASTAPPPAAVPEPPLAAARPPPAAPRSATLRLAS